MTPTPEPMPDGSPEAWPVPPCYPEPMPNYGDPLEEEAA